MGSKQQILKEFGSHLRALIERQGYKSAEHFILSHASLSKASVYKILLGQQECRLMTLLSLAAALEIHPGELLDFHKPVRGKKH